MSRALLLAQPFSPSTQLQVFRLSWPPILSSKAFGWSLDTEGLRGLDMMIRTHLAEAEDVDNVRRIDSVVLRSAEQEGLIGVVDHQPRAGSRGHVCQPLQLCLAEGDTCSSYRPEKGMLFDFEQLG